MKIIFCAPRLTMADTKDAGIFFDTCRNILDDCIVEVPKVYVTAPSAFGKLRIGEAGANDIFIFFNAENGQYSDEFIKLAGKYFSAGSQIWPIAFGRAQECRLPPPPVDKMQSFDISCWSENRNPPGKNIPAVAHMFARKIVAQVLSPLYQDDVLYFISHRRCDGEELAGKLADTLRLLTRKRRVYRDVVEVEVGDDAQADIDGHLRLSDVVIFLQTEQAQHSPFILRELCYALVYGIPVLWIQIDNAPFDALRIRPGEGPALRYAREEFDQLERRIEIAEEIEESCFRLMMNSSNQVCSYIESLMDLSASGKISLRCDRESVLAYEIAYRTIDRYTSRAWRHYVQCFGRNPKPGDVKAFADKVKKTDIYRKNDKIFLLSSHIDPKAPPVGRKVVREDYDNYIANLENVVGRKRDCLGKRIILSGAFPDCDEIYKNSLLEALSVYAKQIIRSGCTLVFGAHPTFQEIIFEIGRLYAPDIRNSIEMHMDRAYAGGYDLPALEGQCRLVLADGLREMRSNMICREKSELLICLGGKIKADKSQQGVDIEAGLARGASVPVALVGTVGGRSGEYALELAQKGDWSSLNPWGKGLNEKLLYNMNHRLVIRKLLDRVLGA